MQTTSTKVRLLGPANIRESLSVIVHSFLLQNHTIERMWVEINKRINYPLKEVLVDMEHKGEIDMDNPLHRYSCSWLTIHVANVGAQYFVASWNAHPIPGIF